MKKRLLSGILAMTMLATLGLTGCGEEKASGGGDTVKIAVAAPMTGDFSEYGLGFYNAAMLQADKWNAEGGVLGKQIEIVQYDDKNSNDEAASIAQKIVSAGDIAGVIGHFASGVCMVAAPVYQENNIVEISPSSSHIDYSDIGDYIFRCNTVINQESAAGLDIAVNDLGNTKIGIIAVQTDWGQSTAAVVEGLVAEQYPQAEIVIREDVMDGSDDYSPAITKLDAAGAEVVICVGMYNVVGPIAKQYKQVNPDIDIVAFSNSYSSELLNLGGDAVEGVCFPVLFFSASEEPMVKDYIAAYTDKYGSAPSALTTQAYDATGILLTAIKAAGSTDSAAVRDQVAAVNYDGVIGKITFNEIGDMTKDFVKVTVKDGVFTPMA